MPQKSAYLRGFLRCAILYPSAGKAAKILREDILMNKNTYTAITLAKGEINLYDFGGISKRDMR